MGRGWGLATVLCSLLIARRVERNAFGNGAAAGFLAGALWTFVQGAMCDTLVAHNPWILEKFANQPEGFDLQFFIMQLAPFMGIADAIIFGATSHLMFRAIKKQEQA